MNNLIIITLIVFSAFVLTELIRRYTLKNNLIDIPIDYESINRTGAIMGSGGMVVMDDRACMVDIAMT